MTDGKQRVTTEGQADSDAIEKPVTVRPEGEEISRTESRLSSGSVEMPLEFPANALRNTPRAELKIFPNMMAHVTESVEGLLKRPISLGESGRNEVYVLVQAALRHQCANTGVGAVRLLQRGGKGDGHADPFQI